MFQTLKAETVVPHAVPVLNKPGDVLHDVPVLNKPEVVPASTSSTPPPTGNHALSERTSNPPGNCKDSGVWGTCKYEGEKTWMIACLTSLVCGFPVCCFFTACPQDEKDAYCVDGKLYDAAGGFIADKKDVNKFIPKRTG